MGVITYFQNGRQISQSINGQYSIFYTIHPRPPIWVSYTWFPRLGLMLKLLNSLNVHEN